MSLQTVLIADDNADLGALLAGILRREGFAVDVVQDPDVGIERSSHTHYGVVLVEPAPSAGFRPLIDYLAAREDGLDSVVMATTDNDDTASSEWLRRGVFRVLHKPLTRERVRDAVAACVERRRFPRH